MVKVSRDSGFECRRETGLIQRQRPQVHMIAAHSPFTRSTVRHGRGAILSGSDGTRVPHTRDITQRLEAARRNLKIINAYEQIEHDFVAMEK